MSEHSRFGGSVCDRYMNCPASVALCATVPKVESRYAAEGTAAHELASRSLTENLHPTHFLGETLEGFEVTQEMCDAVVTYLNVVEHEMARTRTAQYFVEQSFAIDLASAEPGEIHGKNDALVYHPELKRLRAFDYKHGVGVSVSADENAQLKFYALGAILTNNWLVSEIILTIVQPRALDAEETGAVKDWTFSTVEVLEFMGELEEGIKRAKVAGDFIPKFDATAPAAWDARVVDHPEAGSFDLFATGKWCRFCDAAAVCPAREQQAIKAAGLDFVGVKVMGEVTAAALPEPKTFDAERLARTVEGLQIVSDWLSQCRELLEGLVLGGHEVPGWKAVEKIGRAKWVDDPAQIVAFASMMFDLDPAQLMPPKLVTIGDAEKLLKAAGADKAAIDGFKLQFTLKESSGLTVAQASDRRPAVNAAQADFGSANLTALQIAAE